MKRLTNLVIEKVAFVDAGANPGADILIYKRATEPADSEGAPVADDTKFEEAVAKAVAEKVFALEAEHKAQGEVIAALDAMDNDTLAALRGITVAPVEKSDDDVLKALPDEVRERIEKAETQLAKIEGERRTERFAKAAEEFTPLAPVAEIAPVLDALDHADPEIAKSLTQILKAAAARVTEGGLFEEFGKNDGESDPLAKVAAEAAEIRKSDPTLSETDALQQAMARNEAAAKEAFNATK